MARSMTGFGRATHTCPDFTLTWEIASRNARHLELKWKTPPGWTAFQAQWEAAVRQVASRGSVELTLAVRILDPQRTAISLDMAQAAAMVRHLQELAHRLDLPQPADLSPLWAVSSLWREAREDMIPADLVAVATATLHEALAAWDSACQREGTALGADLSARHNTLERLAAAISHEVTELAPRRLETLRGRLAQLLDGAHQLDPSRLSQEIALLADKVDVTEELTRLQAHLMTMGELLAAPGPQGRKLDFLIQEVLREITTCSNKAQSATVSALAVEFKTELEKVREQVQNLE